MRFLYCNNTPRSGREVPHCQCVISLRECQHHQSSDRVPQKTHALSTFTLLLTAALLLLPLCSMTTLVFVSFCILQYVLFFKSSPFFPVNCNADPHVVVLNPSFTSFINLCLVMILFEKVIDVIFPSPFLSSNHSAGPIFLNSSQGSIQQLFFIHLSLGDVAILEANFHFIFLCVLFQQRIFT